MTTRFTFLSTLLSMLVSISSAQDVQLHVDPRWQECSFQLDPSLNQKEFHQFAREAGMVACFRPLTSARNLGAGRFEVSLLQWKTTIDETKGAWNNTFVHPHAEHYLVGGPALAFPGLTAHAGITDKLDAGVYWTVRPGANYGFMGAQLQYGILNAAQHRFDLSSRLGFNSLYGPKDVSFAVYALDLLASKKFTVYKNWLSLSPYAGASVCITRAHERSELVNLKDENVMGLQCMVGAVANVRNFSFAAEYNFAVVNTVSVRLGYNFKLCSAKNRSI
jgi:hypothetical protein